MRASNVLIVAALLLMVGTDLARPEESPSGQASDPRKALVTELDVGPISVRVDCPQRIGLAEVLEVSVTLVAPERVVVQTPQLPQMLGSCKTIELRTEGPDALESRFGRLVARRWYVRLEPLRLGKTQLGELSFEYREGAEAPRTGEIPLPDVEVVQGPTSSADPSTLRPIPDLPVGLRTSPLLRILRWAGGVLLLVTLVAVAVHLKRGSKPSASPVQHALGELRRLEDSELLISGEYRQFVEEVAGVVRDYLQSAYHLNAPRQSTPEFLGDGRAREVLSGAQRASLAQFLESADTEKFAPHEPNEEISRICLRRARGFFAGEPTP